MTGVEGEVGAGADEGSAGLAGAASGGLYSVVHWICAAGRLGVRGLIKVRKMRTRKTSSSIDFGLIAGPKVRKMRTWAVIL